MDDFDEMKDWVGYTEADAHNLHGLREIAEPHVVRIIDIFYREIQRHPGSNGVLTGPEQVERLKSTLRSWLREVFEGPHDAAYAERRRAIGVRHVQVGLPSRYMFTAMHVIERELSRVIRDGCDDPWPMMDSLDRVLALDLALMTGTYVSGREERQLDQLQALLVEHLRLVVLLVDHEGKIRSSTRATSQLMAGQDVAGLPWTQALPPSLLKSASLTEHVARGLERHREITLPRVDTGDRSFRVHIVPLRHPLASFLLQIEELTDVVAMEGRLRRSEALAELGALSAAVAHELRNPLAGISGALQVITRSLEGQPQHTVLTKVDGEIRRLNGLVTELLSFARPGSARLMPTELLPVAEEVVEMMRTAHPHMVFEVSGVGGAEADPNQLRQILHNLLRNAVDAVDDAGTVWVHIDGSVLTVADSGPGITEDRWTEVFKPFSTDKTRGTGLGLAISARAAEAMSGELRLTHSHHPGACFQLTLLPRAH